MYLSSEDLIECTGTSQDDVGVVNLDNTLTESNQVGTNTNSTAGDLEGEGQEEGQEGRGRGGAGRGGAGGKRRRGDDRAE